MNRSLKHSIGGEKFAERDPAKLSRVLDPAAIFFLDFSRISPKALDNFRIFEYNIFMAQNIADRDQE